MPKSVRKTVPFAPHKMLPGFTSRYTIPREWTWASASAPARPFVDLSDAKLDLNLDVNLRATILVTRELIRAMIERGDGVVVSISSQAAKAPSPEASHYSASKAGVLGFTVSLARSRRRSASTRSARAWS